MSLHLAEESREYDRSKGFLFGLYVGLSLLLLVAQIDPRPGSRLPIFTNIYGILALAGAVLGAWRIWKRADKPRTMLALPSFWICIGLAIWVIAQVLWMLDELRGHMVPYGRLSEVAYIAAYVCWVVALLTIFKMLGRRVLTEINRFTAILTVVLGFLVGGFAWIDQSLIRAQMNSPILVRLGTDLVYILLTFAGMILSVALVVGENAKLPLPIHRCLRYLFAATIIDAVATFFFIVTVKLPSTDAMAYSDGNWIDWLFLTAMYCWAVSALKCPIKQTELRYTFGTTRIGISTEDIYRADEIAKHYAGKVPDVELTIDSQSRQWILDNIPGCWRVVKLGDLVVGSSLVFPVPRQVMKSFVPGKTKESEVFEESKRNVPSWDCLYLADASILANHRRRGLAFNCFTTTIDNIVTEHKTEIDVYCWPNTEARKRLAEKLRKHFDEKKGVSVIILE